MKNLLFLILTAFLLQSCSDSNRVKNVERAFYYWKTSEWNFNEKIDLVLNQTKTQKLYIKFFEVEHNDLMGNIPISKNRIRFRNNNIEVIPTIFIKNDVFLKSTTKDLDVLADNMNFLIQKFLKDYYEEDVKINELQMDCDWTINSKTNYFYFLNKIKAISKKKISCTLRLYPYKYPDKMGIPPVDKATLMCYNLLNPLENPKQNSILDVDELSKYVKGVKKYPLHLDIALPIYSWMQLYQNNQFQTVIYESHDYMLKNMKKTEPLWYEITEDFTVGDTYLRIGDKIKYEEVNKVTIDKAIKVLKKNISFDETTTITLFHLDDSQLQKYTNEEISSFYTAFSK